MIDNGEIIDAKAILLLHYAERAGRMRGDENQAAAKPESLGKAQAAASSSAKAARSIEKPSAFAGVPRVSGAIDSAGCILAAGGSWRPLAKSGIA